jgi:hypothetical protein
MNRDKDLSEKDSVTNDLNEIQDSGVNEGSLNPTQPEENIEVEPSAEIEAKEHIPHLETFEVEEVVNKEDDQSPIKVPSNEVSVDVNFNEEKDEHLLVPELAEEEEEGPLDYSSFSKNELLKELKRLHSLGDFQKQDTKINDLKHLYDDFINKEKEEALLKFTNEGGVADDFEFRYNTEDKEFIALYNDFKEKRYKSYKEQEQQKEKNLITKNQILEQLRSLVDGEETTLSINTIKQIQEDWKKIGPVPNAFNKNLWASFNALMDRFYDNRSIYFELKELDRKKNLDHKKEICEKAEALTSVEDLKDAIKSLNDLHEEFKHIGPVPRAEQELLWQRFKAASDAVYGRRKDFYETQKVKYTDNLVQKEALIKRIEEYTDFSSSKIKEWNSKTKEVLALQKEWEAVGSVPKEVGKNVNKKFWGAFKQFFNNKNLFFKELDELRLTNKQHAEDLIAQAEQLSESTDWQDTAAQLISLQEEWRKLGPTPEKVRDELYKRFKAACDSFFEKRRSTNKQVTKEFEDNLKSKISVCEKIETLAKEKTLTQDQLESLIADYNSIGFVPRKNMKDMQIRFNNALDEASKSLGSEGESKDEFLFRLNLTKLQSDPNSERALGKKEFGIRKQITDLENNISLWRNNLEYFAASKTADKLREQFEEKINKAEAEIDKLKQRLAILREY